MIRALIGAFVGSCCIGARAGGLLWGNGTPVNASGITALESRPGVRMLASEGGPSRSTYVLYGLPLPTGGCQYFGILGQGGAVRNRRGEAVAIAEDVPACEALVIRGASPRSATGPAFGNSAISDSW